MGGGRPLTDDEIHTIRSLRRKSKSLEEIAAITGRSRAAVGDVLKGVRIRVHEHNQSQMVIPLSVLAERERRLAAMPRDLTAALAGDPPVGFSMLDRRSA